LYLGDTTDWAGRVDGERGAIAAFRIDYEDFSRARKILAERFPPIEKRLEGYERMIADSSSKHHVALSLECVGVKGVATFYIIARIDSRELAAGNKVEIMRQNVKALKVAWNEIGRYDSRGKQG